MSKHRPDRRCPRQRRPRRFGFFLLVTLVTVSVATLAVYSFTETMVVMDDSAHLESEIVQAEQGVQSGIGMMRLLLSQPAEQRTAIGGTYNNPQLFRAVNLSADQPSDFHFASVATGLTSDGRLGGLRFGLVDESSKLNVNALAVLDRNSELLMPAMTMLIGEDNELAYDNIAVSLLMSLPGMTEDTADAILDWIDEDSEPREYGAEDEYYLALPTAYSAANAPVQSVDDLLLVRGVTAPLLYGADANRNGILDADEQQHYGVSIDTPGALGWAAYLTVHGSESNLGPTGTPRVNINVDDLETLYDDLVTAMGDETYASYVIAFRMYGQSAAAAIDAFAEPSNDDSDNGGQTIDGGIWTAEAMGKLDLTAGGKLEVTQILDLVGSTVEIPGETAVVFQSPFAADPVSMSTYLPLLMDSIATSDAASLPGRINVNECPAELLAGIPILDDETIAAIIENREPMSDDPGRRHATWLLSEGIVSIETMRALTPLICGSGSVFRGQWVAFDATGGAYRRAETIVDATSPNPKVISFRDLSHLGRGFDLSVLGASTFAVE